MAMWSWGMSVLDLPGNPIAKIPKFRHSRARQYVPPEGDLLKMLAVATARERAFLDCYLCTGARRSEIFNLTWDQVNFEHQTIILSTKKTADGSEKSLVLPMNQRLYDSLKWVWNTRKFKESPFVWVIEDGRYAGQPYTFRHKFLKGLAKRAGVRAFGFHSLRRYVATYLSDKEKVATKTIQKILGHSSEATTERYLYNAHKDLEAVMALLGKSKGDIEGGNQHDTRNGEA
jgi:integrase